MEPIPKLQLLAKAQAAAAIHITREQWATFFVSIGKTEMLQRLDAMMAQLTPLELVKHAWKEFGSSPMTGQAVLNEWKKSNTTSTAQPEPAILCGACSQRQQRIAGKDQQEMERLQQWQQSRNKKVWECKACKGSLGAELQHSSKFESKTAASAQPTSNTGWMGQIRDIVCGACGARGPGAEAVLKAIEDAKLAKHKTNEVSGSDEKPSKDTGERAPHKRKGRLKRRKQQQNEKEVM
jgi:hypothetical protein